MSAMDLGFIGHLVGVIADLGAHDRAQGLGGGIGDDLRALLTDRIRREIEGILNSVEPE